jgi:tRNA dimethylallyltransferase
MFKIILIQFITMKKIIILSGPTASGKSSAALHLSQYFNLEIISADSMSVYRFMDIGTDKPSISQRSLVRHHMIDVADPREDYSVYLYSEKTKKIIDSLHKIGKIPIVVGGTGLYIESLFHSIPQTGPDWNLRKKLYDLEKNQPGILYAKLTKIDPEFSKKIDEHNIKRIVRAIEIYELTGKPPSLVREENAKNLTNYEFLKLYIDKERKKLYNNIDKRVDKMIKNGLIEETKFLIKRNLFGKTSSKAIGYKETIDYLNGAFEWEEYIRLLKRNSRRYAKRQIIWFRRYKDFVHIKNEQAAFKFIKSFI